MLIYRKTFLDEKNRECSLEYSLLVSSDGLEPYYGVEIKMTDGEGAEERDAVVGLSDERETAQTFLCRLWETTALPVELVALCDNFISERERKDEEQAVLAVS